MEKIDVKIRMHLVVSHQTETGGKLKTQITHCRWRSVNVAWLKRYPPDRV